MSFRNALFLANILYFLFSSLASAVPLENGNKIPGCDSTNCKLPDCLCMDTSAPLGLKPEEIPQLVFLTFDDSVTDWAVPFYDRIVEGRKNPNGCPITLTYFVRHDQTNYQAVNRFYNRGDDIASHTVTHYADNRTYWSEGSYDLWMSEIDQQRDFINRFANIPKDDIQGFRAPYLQTGGDPTYQVLKSLGMSYDSSLGTRAYMDPPLWPYTLDFGATQDCRTKPCPEDVYPGIWEIPIVNFQDQTGGYCGMMDSCVLPETEGEMYDYLMSNYVRYNATRAPFGIYGHPYRFRDNPYTLDGYLHFIDDLSRVNDVYFVTISQGLKWLSNPMKISQLPDNDVFGCSQPEDPALCEPIDCVYTDSIPGGRRTMKSCTSPCPPEYPWVEIP